MVWIMSLSMGFGEFFPDGNWEDGDSPEAIGWSGRLKALIKALPDEQRRELLSSGDWFDYAYYVSKKFIHEVGSKPDIDLPLITPVLPHEAPTTFNTAKSYKSLGDFIMLNDRILAVSEGMKTILEGLDRGVHQFFPIEIIQPRSVYPEQFFTLVVGNYRDSFKGAKGNMETLKPEQRHSFASVNQKEAATLHFEKSAFEGAHLWRERVLSESLVMFSDQLMAGIEEVGLNIPKLHKATEAL